MKNEDTIEELIQKLTRLQLQQTQTINRIAELRINEQSTVADTADLDTISTQSEQEQEYYRYDNQTHQYDRRKSVVNQDYVRRNLSVKKESSIGFSWIPAPHNANPADTFIEGTRVYITNKITQRTKGIKDERDRRATVRHIEYRAGEVRVHFTTDNHFDTFRFPKYRQWRQRCHTWRW